MYEICPPSFAEPIRHPWHLHPNLKTRQQHNQAQEDLHNNLKVLLRTLCGMGLWQASLSCWAVGCDEQGTALVSRDLPLGH